MSYRPVLIHTGAIAESIAEREYFASVIDFGELMAIRVRNFRSSQRNSFLVRRFASNQVSRTSGQRCS